MKCPYCGHLDDRVIDSRSSREGDVIRRRRECLECQRRFTSYERVGEDILPVLIKKDGRREPFNRKKVLTGLMKACEKRPISVEIHEEVLKSIEKKLLSLGDREVPSSIVGEEIMAHLREIDKVAYVRFASVYREFKDVKEFTEEVKTLTPRGRGGRR